VVGLVGKILFPANYNREFQR